MKAYDTAIRRRLLEALWECWPASVGQLKERAIEIDPDSAPLLKYAHNAVTRMVEAGLLGPLDGRGVAPALYVPGVTLEGQSVKLERNGGRLELVCSAAGESEDTAGVSALGGQ